MTEQCQGPYHEPPTEGLVVAPPPPVHIFQVPSDPDKRVFLCEKCCVEELHGLLRALPEEKQREWLQRFGR